MAKVSWRPSPLTVHILRSQARCGSVAKHLNMTLVVSMVIRLADSGLCSITCIHIPSSLSYTVSSLSLSDDLKTDRPWIATTITQSINYIQPYPSSAYSIWAQGNQSASPFCFALALYRVRFFTSCSLSFVLSTRPRCVQASWLMSSAVCSAAAMPVSWAWVVLMWVSNRSLWEAMG